MLTSLQSSTSVAVSPASMLTSLQSSTSVAVSPASPAAPFTLSPPRMSRAASKIQGIRDGY